MKKSYCDICGTEMGENDELNEAFNLFGLKIYQNQRKLDVCSVCKTAFEKWKEDRTKAAGQKVDTQ